MYSYIRFGRVCVAHRVQRNCCTILFPKRMISTYKDKEEEVSEEPFMPKSEAIAFVEDVLEIPNPVVLATEDSWSFLCKFHTKMKTIVPFTNLIYFNRNGAHNISFEERKRAVFTKQGGTCFDVYPVLQAVLRYLGFETLLISGSSSAIKTNITISHVGLFVKNVTYPGSLHLIEPGTRYPILQPVPLEFKRFSPEYQVGHYPVRFFKREPGIVIMCSPADDGDDVGENKFIIDGRVWKALLTYRTREILTPRTCQKVIERIVRDGGAIPDMHVGLLIFGFSQGLPTSIVGNKFCQYKSSGLTKQSVIKKMNTNIEVLETIQEHFPQYSPHQVEEALMFWNP